MSALSSPGLASRVLAAIDETERIARAVEDNSAPWDGQWKNDHDRAVRTYNDWVLAYRHDGTPFRPGVLAHIAHNDPAAVLRRCEADRRIVGRHSRPGRAEVHGNQDGTWLMQWCNCCGAPMPCPDLLDLAKGYGIAE